MNTFFKDEEIETLIKQESSRQKKMYNLIASENDCYPEILKISNSIFTNKYAEGTYKNRFYEGCQYANELEELTIKRAMNLFDAESANVQPHCGSSANIIAYLALLNPGDTILSMDFSCGGHLSHGYEKHISGKLYTIKTYSLDPISNLIDYDIIEDCIKKEQPKLIISGASSYSRLIDYEKIYSLARKYNCYHLCDISHIAGLIAAKIIPSPVPYADIITSTTQKTLRGPRSAFILSKKEFETQINRAVMPGLQGGPFLHMIAAKAMIFKMAQEEQYIKYQKQVIENAQLMAHICLENNLHVITDGTDNHLFMINTLKEGRTGKEVAEKLEKEGIIVNKNCIPFDTLSPLLCSGIRIGTPFITAQKKTKEEIITLTEKIIYIIKS